MTALPPFSGDTPPCPKCGGTIATTAYRKKGEPRALDMFAVLPKDRGERLERRCGRCWYAWDEALATAEPEPESVLPSAETVAENCRKLHSRWTWDWMRTKQFPSAVQLHDELYRAITDIPSRVGEDE